jgi:outer membrane protein OmpA-like peptidoglycan-associated protein
LEAGAKRELKNVFFDVNRFELRMESAAELDVLVQLLSENPTLRIEIGGHTDNIGKTADNLLLSQNRAQSVRDYLIKKNINPERLTAKGYGASQPVADNRTDTGRARNRRTEIRVLAP